MSHVILAKRKAGGSYKIEFYRDGGRLRIRCNCDAGSVGQLCRHKRALIAGNPKMLFDPAQGGMLKEILAWPETQMLVERARGYERELAEIELKKKALEDEAQALMQRYASDCLDGVHEK